MKHSSLIAMPPKVGLVIYSVGPPASLEVGVMATGSPPVIGG